MTEIHFIIEDAPEGGYIARALNASIVIEADDIPSLHAQLRDALQKIWSAGVLARLLTMDRYSFVAGEDARAPLAALNLMVVVPKRRLECLPSVFVEEGIRIDKYLTHN